MAMKGPLRNPDSRRGRREMPDYKPEDPELPEPPAWLTAAAKLVFTTLVTDLAKAGVPIKLADAHALALTSYALTQAQEWALREQKVRKIQQKLDCSRMAA